MRHLSEGRVLKMQRQAITWTNAHFLSIGPLGANFSEIWIKIQKFFQENVFENVVCEIVVYFVSASMY